ncbi:galactose-1-phosphate uridylyltransferase [Anabaenopsis circularis NIES-21]|uniref:Galactose-1-phosphate uridylyltransferase n=1 Tax=Anabaenopsis circularis NIES-21 TaxID=1085406 RepID=A0A1Z4GJS2_9CYAN|nr:galactose-1-phosphate uridylyltransferase [Anabaenopsis circularis NIES-21]
MYSHKLLKPDGRKLTLYSRYPITSPHLSLLPENNLGYLQHKAFIKKAICGTFY